MGKTCRQYQMQWMEALDEGYPVDVDVAVHVDRCPECSRWRTYLMAERQAVTAWSPSETPPVRWRSLRTSSRFSPRWVWGVGLALILVGLGLLFFYRWVLLSSPPSPSPAWTETLEMVDVLSALEMESLTTSLAASPLWWTDEELRALARSQPNEAGRIQP